MSTDFTRAIAIRYDGLSEKDCCLSCGGAINYAEIHPGYKCVDLGSGKGFDVLKMAAKAGLGGFAWGVDVSESMMQTAMNNAEKMGLDNVSFICSELEDIKLEDNVADVVLSNCTINHSLDQSRVWKEVFRILKPGGTFVVSDIYALETVSEAFRNDPAAVAECWAGAVTKQKYLENISNAGFTVFEFIEESKPYEKGQIKVCSFTIKGSKLMSFS